MNRMSYRGFEADISVDEDDEIFFGHLRDVPASVSFHGATYRTLRAAMIEAVDDYVDWIGSDEEIANRFADAGFGIDPLTGDLERRRAA